MSRRNLFFFGGLATAVGAVTGLRLWMEHDDYGTRKKINREEEQAIHKWVPLDRSKTLENLAQTDEPYDLLIIGGGATGTGCALDAARRGLRVALIERGDFASGTSSKSTKLLHGGVRYLEKAALGFDREQLKLVREALSERLTIIRIAPHLSDQLAIMLPVYSNLWLPYYWLGAKAYDFLAGKQGLNPSYILGRKGVIEAFPAIKKKGLSGAIVYHDGVQDDARMNVSLALTAAFWGAHVINYVEAVDLIFSDEVQKENTEQLQKIAKIDTSEMKPVDSSEGELRLKGKVCGAVVIDRLTGKKFSIKARGVINATGPFCDAVRKMEDLNTRPMVNPSAGAHLILPSYYIPRKMGLIDPSSDDGRVLFLLPWEDASIAGTTGK